MKLEDTGQTFVDLDFNIDLKKLVKFPYAINGEKKAIHVRNFLKIIKYAVEALSYKYDCSQARIERVCMQHGAGFIYRLPGFQQIERTRRYIINNFLHVDDIRKIQGRIFDLGSSETTEFYNKFPGNIVTTCASQANRLGISMSVCFQMTLLGTLIFAREEFNANLYNPMARILQRFRLDVERWGEQAAEAENQCRRINANAHQEAKIECLEAAGINFIYDESDKLGW